MKVYEIHNICIMKYSHDFKDYESFDDWPDTVG